MNKEIIPNLVRNISYDEVKRLIEDFQKIKSPDAISPESLGVILKLILQYPNEVVWDNDDIWEFINQVNTDLSADISRLVNDLKAEAEQRKKDVIQLGSDIQQGDEETYKSVKENLFDPLAESVRINSGNIADLETDLSDEIGNREIADRDVKEYALNEVADAEKRINAKIKTLDDINTDEHGSLMQDIEDEQTARIAGDETLDQKMATMQTLLEADVQAEETARIAADNTAKAAIDALADQLNTLIGNGDVTGVIDTFNEIEAFLAGISNSENLTELLLDLKTDILNIIEGKYQAQEDGKGLSANDFSDELKAKLIALPNVLVLQEIATSKAEGKGLSSNDFTNALKNKLSQLPTASELQTALDNKVDVEEGKGLSSNDFTAEHKEKLEALPCAEDIEFQFNELNEHVGQHDTQISDLSDSVEDLYVAFDFISAQFNALNSRFTDYLKKWEGTIDEFCDDFSEIDNNTLYFIYIPNNVLFTVFYGRQQVWVDQSINTISGFISPDGSDDWYGFPFTYLNRVTFEFFSCKSDSNLQFNSRLDHPIYLIDTDDDYTHRSLKSCTYPPAMYINVSFSMCDLLESIYLSKIRRFYFPNLFECFFEGCTSLKSAYLDGMDTLNLTSLYKSFYNCHSLISLYIKGWDFSNVTNFDYAFVYCISLKNIYGPVHGIKADIDISDSQLLTRQSALVLINGLEEVSTSQTIYFNESAFERLTNADIAIANAKGWNVVGC